MALRGVREASHAGSWYEENAAKLSAQLDSFLDRVPNTLGETGLPIPGARAIIAPWVADTFCTMPWPSAYMRLPHRHAGYAYSGPCAAWAYKAFNLSGAKRVFILGPSHTYPLGGCALTTYSKYETPFGPLVVDELVYAELRDTGHFADIRRQGDVDEHSLEMHLPYLWKRLEQTFGANADRFPTIVPIMVGSNDDSREKRFGQVLAPYVGKAENRFIVSSDFCHWGDRFGYQPYCPSGKFEGKSKFAKLSRLAGRVEPPIHETIRMLDQMVMDAIEAGVHSDFVDVVDETDNTVCGRHPIGVLMAALETLAMEGVGEGKAKFKFVQYQRSSLVERTNDSSVSYASAYAII